MKFTSNRSSVPKVLGLGAILFNAPLGGAYSMPVVVGPQMENPQITVTVPNDPESVSPMEGVALSIVSQPSFFDGPVTITPAQISSIAPGESGSFTINFSVSATGEDGVPESLVFTARTTTPNTYPRAEDTQVSFNIADPALLV